jgi:hypothetical protein
MRPVPCGSQREGNKSWLFGSIQRMDTQRIPQSAPLAHIRAGWGEWSVVGIFALVGAGIIVMVAHAPYPPKSICEWLGIAAFASFAPLLFGGILLQHEVLADERGLRWRRWFRWRRCDWDDVTDYYEVPLQNSTKGPIVIETKSGNLRLIPTILQVKPLKPVVQQYATHAKATEWAIRGARPEDWPRAFNYRTSANRTMPYIFWISLPVMVACCGYIVAPKLHMLSGPGAIWSWLGVGMICLAMGGMLLLVIVVAGPAAGAYRRRRGQRITVDINGIVYESAESHVTASWDDVADYYKATSRTGLIETWRYVIETTAGEFDFTGRIGDPTVLTAIIENQCLGVREPGWRRVGPDSEQIADRPRSWPQERDQDCAQRFTYRTRFNRVSLAGLTAIAICPLIGIAIEHIAGVPVANPLTPIAFAAALLLFCAWAWWRYFRGGVTIDGEGVTKADPFGETRLLWPQITDYHQAGGDIFVFGVVAAGRKKISFWQGIARCNDLKAEIQKRALNSQNKNWEE